MSKNRAFVVVLGLAVIVFSGLYPPWIQQIVGSAQQMPMTIARYGWLWSPPFENVYGNVGVDWQRLLITWVLIAAATTCLFILMPYLAKSSAPKGRD